MFGIIFPGQPLIVDFLQISETQWTYEIPNAGQVNNMTFFLQRPLPQGFALALSSSYYPYNTIEFIGAIANERPSDIIHTGWGFKQDAASNPVKLLISMEAIANIATLVYDKSSTDIRQVYAKKVALNLFRFMESFNKSTSQQGFLVLPGDILDKWLVRFESKFRVDPYFVLNTE